MEDVSPVVLHLPALQEQLIKKKQNEPEMVYLSFE